MTIPRAILLSAMILAGAHIFIDRWQVATPGILLDKWTGQMQFCPIGNGPGRMSCAAE